MLLYYLPYEVEVQVEAGVGGDVSETIKRSPADLRVTVFHFL